jgi:hypothetical protein
MSKWYYTPEYAAYAPLDAEVKEMPKDDKTVGRVLVEDVAGFFCRLTGVYRDSRQSLVVRWMHVEKQPFPVLKAATPRDANKIVYRDDMKELGFLVGAIEGEVEPKYAYCEPNKGIQTVGRAYVKNDPPTEERRRSVAFYKNMMDGRFIDPSVNPVVSTSRLHREDGAEEIKPCPRVELTEDLKGDIVIAEGLLQREIERCFGRYSPSVGLVHGNGKVDLELAQRIVDFLNELRELDPKLVNSLFRFRPECNKAVADHPTIQVCGNQHRWRVGLLGLLNGLCGVDANGCGPIWALVPDKDEHSIIRFEMRKVYSPKGGWMQDQGELGSCRHSGSVAAVQDCHVGCELPVLTPEVTETLKEGLDSKRTVTNLGDNLNIKYQWRCNPEGDMEVTDLDTGEVMKESPAAPDVENQAYKVKWVPAQKYHVGLLARFCNESDMAYTYGILKDVKDSRYWCSTATSNVWCDECEVQVFDTTAMQVNPPDMKPKEVLKPSDLPKSLFGIPVVLGEFESQVNDKMELRSLKDSYQIAVTEIGGENAKVPLKVSRWRRATRGDVGRIARFADENSSWDYGVLASVAEGVSCPFMVSIPVRPEGQYWYERCEVEVFRMEVERKPEAGIPVSGQKAATSPKDFGQKFEALKQVRPLTPQAIQVAYARMKDRPQSATVSVPKEFAELVDKLDDEKGDTIMPDIAPEELAKVIADTKNEAFPLVDKREAGGIVVPKELEAGMQDMLQKGYEECKAIEINMQAVLMCFDHRTGELNLVTPGGFKLISAKTSWLVAKNIAKLAGAGIRDIGLDRGNGS